MEVIFIKDLKNQGKKGQVKNVKDGYGENFLIKNGYAILKTKENMQKLTHEMKLKEKAEEEQKNTAIEIKNKLNNMTFEFKVKTGEGDKVFGSVSIKQIKEALSSKNFKIDKNKIEPTSSLASLGFHDVNINLYPGVTAVIKAHLVK